MRLTSQTGGRGRGVTTVGSRSLPSGIQAAREDGESALSEHDIECLSCGWMCDPGECVCSKEDHESDKPTDDIQFNVCPQCGAVGDFEEET